MHVNKGHSDIGLLLNNGKPSKFNEIGISL